MSTNNSDQPMWSAQFLEGQEPKSLQHRGTQNQLASESLTWITSFLITLLVFVLAFLFQMN